MRSPAPGPLYLLFFASGAASLVYEVVWTRMLGVALGTDAVAVSLVLAGFMAGLAAGAAGGAWLSARLGGDGGAETCASRYAGGANAARRALTAYGLLEVAVAVAALLAPVAAGALAGLPVGASWPAAALLLALPAAAMGATFPLACAAAAASAVGSPAAAKRGGAAAFLYAMNTLGAVAGTLAAAHLLLPNLGVRATNLVAAACSASVGVGALAWALAGWSVAERAGEADRGDGGRGGGGQPGRGSARSAAALAPRLGAEPEAGGGVAEAPTPLAGARLAGAAFAAGFGGLALEVASTRILAMVMGGTVYAFAAMLSAFLLGIGSGSLAVGVLARRVRARTARAMATCALIVSALAATIAAQRAEGLPLTFVRLYRTVGASPLLEGALAGLVLLGPALGLGAGFAGLLRASGGDRDARRAGGLYAANTVGAVLGALATGLVTVPLLGLDRAFALAIGALLLAAGLASEVRLGAAFLLAAAACAGLGGVFLDVGSVRLRPSRLAIGAFAFVAERGADLDEDALVRDLAASGVETVFHADGRSASVTVERFVALNTVYLKTNGKAEGSAPIDPSRPSQADMATQVSLAFAPLTLPGPTRRVLVIGLGGGVTLGAALAMPEEVVAEVTLVEIEPRVIDGVRSSRELQRASRHALDDRRLTIEVGDARRLLAAAPAGAFDVIVSQPSDPWLAGVANLFTVEAFLAGRRALAPGGRFCQWVQLYGLDAEGLRTLLGTFTAAFPEVYAMRPRGARELLLVGSERPLVMDIDAVGERLHGVRAREMLEAASLWPPMRFLGQWVADRPVIEAFAATAAPSTDDQNRIEFLAPRSRFVSPAVAEALHRDLLAARPAPLGLFGGPGALGRERRAALARGALEAGNLYTAEAWARGLPSTGEPVRGEVDLLRTLGDGYLLRGEPGAALLCWLETLRRDPYDEATRTRVLLAAQKVKEGGVPGE